MNMNANNYESKKNLFINTAALTTTTGYNHNNK